MLDNSIAIIGAGNGGQAFAGWFSLHGYNVRIFDVVQETVDRLNELGGVTIEGNSDVTGFGKIELASTDMEKVIGNAKVIMIVLPSLYHKNMGMQMAPYLQDGQCVVLNPNASLGTVEFKKVLKDAGCTKDILLTCTCTLLFACRATEVGHVVVAGQKGSLTAAADPYSRNKEAQEVLGEIIPQLDFSEDIFRVSLDNVNAIVHPGPTLLNTGRIESQTPFQYYLDMTPSEVELISALDKERMEIAKAYDVHCPTMKETYEVMYNTYADTLYEAVIHCEGHRGVMGQTTMYNRYILEDIPNSLVAYQTMAQVAGIPTPVTDAVITVARATVKGIEEGRTVKNLGLEGMSLEEFIKSCRG